MAPKQRMRIANEIASKNITMRGNVPKSTKVRKSNNDLPNYRSFYCLITKFVMPTY